MDKNFVKTAIEGLKSSSSSRVQEALLKIRSKVIADAKGLHFFRECGGLEHLVPHLRKPNERILDLTLSILGNCCLDDQTCLAAGQLNIFTPIVTVLKTVSRDSIIGRACRVVGNLAQKSSNAEELHNQGAVSALITLIENRDKNTSYPTLTMAVRAIRQLWMVSDKKDEMLSVNSARCIAILLAAECESAGFIKSTNPLKEPAELRKSQEELISGILKCLGYFTTHATSPCADQLQGDGRGYQCLVALTKKFESLALKCLMNLCYLPATRPLLGTAGMVECLVGILHKHQAVSWWPEGAARALSQLSGESVNRSRLRHCGGLPLLVAAARESMHAMRALLQYVFDESSVQILVNEGLITLLTEELTKHLETMKYEHSYNEPETEKLNALPCAECSESLDTSLTSTDVTDEKSALFRRRKGPLSNEDELKVVIERDNMIVGFIDAVDSGSDDDSTNEEEPSRNKNLKRARSRSPATKKCQERSKDWSVGVYWEPKSPEWPSTSRSITSPEHGALSPYSDGNQSGFSAEYKYSKRGRWDWSPESGVSSGEGAASPYWTEYQWSPSSSCSPTSPFSTNNEDSSDSEISGRYSPVCSDNESAEVGGGGDGACEEVDAALEAFDELLVHDADINDHEPFHELKEELSTERASSRIACVLVLLYRVSHGGAESSTLVAGAECLPALLEYVARCRKPLGRAARILTTLLGNSLCLVNILKHKLTLRLHKMTVTSKHPVSKCQQCKQIKRLSVKLLAQLTRVAESSHGIGEISYQLLRGPPDMKETLTLTLPYIVRTERPLKKFFIDCSALNLLFSAVSEDTEHFEQYVTAIGKLATSIRVKDPKLLERKFSGHVTVSYHSVVDVASVAEPVTFQLDDRSTVRADRPFLCRTSDVFSAMLMGCFKESIQACVRLQHVTKQGLEYLLTLLHLGLNDSNRSIRVFPLADNLQTNLEVLLLADRFLFEKLKELLSSAILQFQLTPETAHNIYVWSLSEGMGFLCIESVAYLLTGSMCDKERSGSFRTILGMEYREQWLEDVRSVITRQLDRTH